MNAALTRLREDSEQLLLLLLLLLLERFGKEAVQPSVLRRLTVCK